MTFEEFKEQVRKHQETTGEKNADTLLRSAYEIGNAMAALNTRIEALEAAATAPKNATQPTGKK